MNAITNYQALRAKVEAKFDEIRARQPRQFACAKGCHSCCKPALTVSAVEAAAIRLHLAAHPGVVPQDAHAGTRCSFLNTAGACTIYDARPIVCLSHGAPIEVTPLKGGAKLRDVCPLNFTGIAKNEIPAADVMNVDTVNTILALINSQMGGKPEARTALADLRAP